MFRERETFATRDGTEYARNNDRFIKDRWRRRSYIVRKVEILRNIFFRIGNNEIIGDFFFCKRFASRFPWRVFSRERSTGTKRSTYASVEEDSGKEWHDLDKWNRADLSIDLPGLNLYLTSLARPFVSRDATIAFATIMATTMHTQLQLQLRIVPSNDARIARAFSRPIAIVR